MIRITTFAGKRVAVFGLGASGLASARALIEGGAEVAAWDDSDAGRDAAEQVGIPLVDLRTADWAQFAALVLAPGVPLTHPEPHWTVKAASAAGVEVIGDVELFCRERRVQGFDVPLIATTGTNGKSTTTALTTHLIRGLGNDVEMGGNIGTAILSLKPFAPGRIYVVEMSSFQIDLTPTLDPTVGVLLNVTPDHLERHGTIERYAAIKARLAIGAGAACIGTEDAWTTAIAEDLPKSVRLYAFTTGKGSTIVPSVYAMGTTVFAHETEGAIARSREIADLDGIGSLRGRHNVQNALAALTALRALDEILAVRIWEPDTLRALIDSFSGLPHRMEEVGKAGRVLFVNDSKATNADSTEKALLSWERDIFWIAGGRAKEGGIEPLVPLMPRVAKAYLIGEAAAEFSQTLSGSNTAFETSGTLDIATAAAARDAAASQGPEPVILLSPACASYDQFKNFEVRGDAYRNLVRAYISTRAEAEP